MSAALSVTPASGAILSKRTLCRVDVTGVPLNDTTAYNASNVPTEPEIRYYIRARATGQDDLKSEQFAPSQDGKHTWYGPVFPAAATWTITLRKVVGDTQVATLAAIVS